MIRELVIKEFKALLEDNKKEVAYIVEVAEKAGLTNEQFYIDWEDFLNKVSIKDHKTGISSNGKEATLIRK